MARVVIRYSAVPHINTYRTMTILGDFPRLFHVPPQDAGPTGPDLEEAGLGCRRPTCFCMPGKHKTEFRGEKGEHRNEINRNRNVSFRSESPSHGKSRLAVVEGRRARAKIDDFLSSPRVTGHHPLRVIH